MPNLDYKPYSERHRPHIHPAGATVFVTYRLAGSIPQVVLRAHKTKRDWLEAELTRARKAEVGSGVIDDQKWYERVEEFHREWFLKFEATLHKANSGPIWLQDKRVAGNVADGIHRLNGHAYTLDAYCIMSNHVHVVFKPLLSEIELRGSFDVAGHLVFLSEHPGLSRIMQSLKGRSARECNLILSRSGRFWEHESFDHVVRPGKLMSTIRYVLDNPVKAGLVANWQRWPWTYCRSELLSE